MNQGVVQTFREQPWLLYSPHVTQTRHADTGLVFGDVRRKAVAALLVFDRLLKRRHDPVQQKGRSFRNYHLHTTHILLPTEAQCACNADVPQSHRQVQPDNGEAKELRILPCVLLRRSRNIT